MADRRRGLGPTLIVAALTVVALAVLLFRAARPLVLPGLFIAAFVVVAPFIYRFVRGGAATGLRLLAATGLGMGLCLSLALAVASRAPLAPLKEALARDGRAERAGAPPGRVYLRQGIAWLADSELGVLLGRAWAPTATSVGRDDRVVGVAFTLLLVSTFAALWPLWLFVRLLAGLHEADVAALLYATTPAVVLNAPALDAAVVPLTTAGAAALALWGTHLRRPWAVVLGGALLSAGLLVTQALLPLVLLVGLLPLCDALIAARATDSRPRRALRGLVLTLLFGAGLLAVQAPFVFLLRYEAWAGLRFAGGDLSWLAGDPLRFFLWVGVPTTAAFLVRAVRADRSQAGYVVLATNVILAAANAVGLGRGEAHRAWLPFVPFVVAGAAMTLARWEDEGHERVVPVALALEAATAFVIKMSG